MKNKIIIGTDALDAMEFEFGFAHGIDGQTYILLQRPIHTDALPKHMVGALAIPVLDNANIPQGEPAILLWLDMFCANATELCQAVVVPVGQYITDDVKKTLRQMMWPKNIDSEKLSIRRTEIQAILENNLFETPEDEQALVDEAEHIDLLLAEKDQPKQEGKKSPCFELTPESAKPGDKVFAVVQAHKLNKLGRRYRTNTFVAVDLMISEIRLSADGTTINGFYEEKVDGYVMPVTFNVENLLAEAIFYDRKAAIAHAKELNQDDDEVLYLVNGTVLVYIQRSDVGLDYTLYNAKTLSLIDGGRFDTIPSDALPPHSMSDAFDEICEFHNLDHKWIKKLDPNVIRQNPLVSAD